MISQNGQTGLNRRKANTAVLRGKVPAASAAETNDEKS